MTMRTSLLCLAFAAAFPLLTAGCAISTATVTSPTAGLACIDDSMNCIKKRQATLRYLVNDSSKAWIRQKPSATAYASGVRLFAFRKTKTSLSCDELKIGRLEADAAPKILRSAGKGTLSPAQVSRGTMLAAEVSRDLRREQRKRCKGKA